MAHGAAASRSRVPLSPQQPCWRRETSRPPPGASPDLLGSAETVGRVPPERGDRPVLCSWCVQTRVTTVHGITPTSWNEIKGQFLSRAVTVSPGGRGHPGVFITGPISFQLRALSALQHLPEDTSTGTDFESLGKSVKCTCRLCSHAFLVVAVCPALPNGPPNPKLKTIPSSFRFKSEKDTKKTPYICSHVLRHL